MNEIEAVRQELADVNYKFSLCKEEKARLQELCRIHLSDPEWKTHFSDLEDVQNRQFELIDQKMELTAKLKNLTSKALDEINLI